jgi:hypothetical protein
MRGLDPRIHQKRLFGKMDYRVKPGKDESSAMRICQNPNRILTGEA